VVEDSKEKYINKAKAVESLEQNLD